MPKFWEVRPLHTTIVELLGKKQRASTDVELYKSLKEYYDDLSFGSLNKTLMKLEVGGIVRVFNLTKNKRRVELVTGPRKYTA